jgi:phosphatidylglycerophosphate synthase
MRTFSALMSILAWPNNLVTLGRGVIVSALVGALAMDWRVDPVIGASVFVAAYFLSDYVDGWLARRLRKCSAFGETLDLLVDRWCDILLAAFLLRAAPAHAPALIGFLLLRIAPEVVIGRFTGAVPGMFTAAAERFMSASVAARSMDLAAAARTIFFVWALFGAPPAWAGILIVLPAALFAGFTVCVLAQLAASALQERASAR